MSRRIATPFAQELLDKATPEWDGDVSPSGVPCLTGWVPDASESRGKRHVVIAEFHGANDMLDLALASNAADLARSLIETEAERDEARRYLKMVGTLAWNGGLLNRIEAAACGVDPALLDEVAR